MALLNSDIDAVEAALPFIITLGSNIFEIFVGAYLLYYIVGDAAFLALIPVLGENSQTKTPSKLYAD